jgi:hypothetical protein
MLYSALSPYSFIDFLSFTYIQSDIFTCISYCRCEK